MASPSRATPGVARADTAVPSASEEPPSDPIHPCVRLPDRSLPSAPDRVRFDEPQPEISPVQGPARNVQTVSNLAHHAHSPSPSAPVPRPVPADETLQGGLNANAVSKTRAASPMPSPRAGDSAGVQAVSSTSTDAVKREGETSRTYSEALSPVPNVMEFFPSTCYFASHSDADVDRSDIPTSTKEKAPSDLLTFSQAVEILAHPLDQRSTANATMRRRAKALLDTCTPLSSQGTTDEGLPTTPLIITTISFRPSDTHGFQAPEHVRKLFTNAAQQIGIDVPPHLLVCEVAAGYSTIFYIRDHLDIFRRILQNVKVVYDQLAISPLPFEGLMRTPSLGKAIHACHRVTYEAWTAVAIPTYKSRVPAHVRAALAAGTLNAVSKVVANFPARVPAVQ